MKKTIQHKKYLLPRILTAAFILISQTVLAAPPISPGSKTSANSKLSWQLLPGPYGGNVTSVAVSPWDSYTLYAGIGGVGVFKSTNGGTSWVAFNNGLTNTGVDQVVVNQGYVYAVTFNGGIFKSPQQSANWQAINTGLPSPYVNDLVVSNDILYAAVSTSIYQSTNGGATWTLFNSFPSPPQALLVKANVIYVGTYQNGVYKSVNNRKILDAN